MFDTMFGTDPEIFIVDDNGCVPPVYIRENFGVKLEPDKSLWRGNDWKITEDGAAAEINIRPTNNAKVFHRRLENAKRFLRRHVSDNYNMDVLTSPSVRFDVSRYWDGRDESFRDCVRFGCDPHLDIYSGEYSQEVAVDDVELRFGGGHIHMQAPENENNLFEDVYYFTTRLMDILVGNTIVALRRDIDTIERERQRLDYYGMPGTIRLQEYQDGVKGIEYRVPSNFWINSEENVLAVLTLMNSVFNLSRHPEDASEILDNSSFSSVPNNILNFNRKNARNTAEHVLDNLVSMGYINYHQFADILSLCV